MRNICTIFTFLIFTIFTFLINGCNDEIEVQKGEKSYDVFSEIHPPILTISKTFGIVITAYNRPNYLSETLQSLEKSDLSDAIIVIVDDASTDQETINLIRNFNPKNVPVIKIAHTKNSGVLTGLLHGFKILSRNVKYVLNIDSDVIMKPNWLSSLASAYEDIKDPNIILSGFNTNNHKTKHCTDKWCEKESLGGINFFMSGDFCETHFLKFFQYKNRLLRSVWVGFDWAIIGMMQKNGYRLYTTNSSVIQHIGENGIHSSHGRMDVADDF